MSAAHGVNPPHEVYILCTCPDPDTCETNNLVADRNTGWKEAWRMQAELERLKHACVCTSTAAPSAA